MCWFSAAPEQLVLRRSFPMGKWPQSISDLENRNQLAQERSGRLPERAEVLPLLISVLLGLQALTGFSYRGADGNRSHVLGCGFRDLCKML